MSDNKESIFPKTSMAYEAERNTKSITNTNADENNFFPQTSIAYENEVKSTRVTPGMGKGFLPPLKKNS